MVHLGQRPDEYMCKREEAELLIRINLTYVCIALFLKFQLRFTAEKTNLKRRSYNKKEMVRTELIKFGKKNKNYKFASNLRLQKLCERAKL